MPHFKEVVELAGLAVDGVGVLVIVLGMLIASVRFALPAAPTLQSVVVLGLIVLVRTFLSFALEVELEGHLPWRGRDPDQRTTEAETS